MYAIDSALNSSKGEHPYVEAVVDAAKSIIDSGDKPEEGVMSNQTGNVSRTETNGFEAKSSLWEQANDAGRDVKIYVHWSAGHYGSFFDDYHVNVDKDGSIYVSTDDLSEVKAHTYCRNTGAIGIAAACCAGSSLDGDGTAHLGDEPPTDDQIEAISQIICVLADALDLTIDIQRVLYIKPHLN